MTTARITFYNVGLNEKNLPWSRARLDAILDAGVITQDGQPYRLRLSDLALGQPFNVDAMTYKIIRNATYCQILSTDSRGTGTGDTVASYRYCFINNFLQLANGNWAVSYTIDDWTSFYLSDTSPYNIQIDGFTERANVPLLIDGKVNTTTIPLTGKRDAKGQKRVLTCTRSMFQVDGEPFRLLPQGYKCAVYFISAPKFNGSPSNATAHGTVTDYDIKTKTTRNIRRDNSNLYFMVFDRNGKNLPMWAPDNSVVLAGNVYNSYDVNDSTIEKIMYFDFIPSLDTPTNLYGYDYENDVVRVNSSLDNFLRSKLCDIYYDRDNSRYFKALYMTNFCPLTDAFIPFAALESAMINELPFVKRNAYNLYLADSLYQSIEEYHTIKIKFLTTEIELPVEFVKRNVRFIMGYSGDGETITLKFRQSATDTTITDENVFTSTGQNINYFDLTLVADFKAYKNAKITGAAGIAATVVGSTVALGSSMATGNVAGVVGSLSGGATGVIGAIQKMQGLTPYQQSPANGDYTLTQMINDNDIPLIIEVTEELPKNKPAMLRYLEENGAAVEMPFDEYRTNCQMEAFNALKMASVEVTGVPQQISRRIEEMLLNGVTLWTSTDVGNKKVINYPINS